MPYKRVDLTVQAKALFHPADFSDKNYRFEKVVSGFFSIDYGVFYG
ncbi:MAG: hypothetical protein LBM00_05290 [Deltaproteobacteria bacterium]|jgi:hypothetical protein|nr:hypothetical protein [Deltaproteobacteria bacterium]